MRSDILRRRRIALIGFALLAGANLLWVAGALAMSA